MADRYISRDMAIARLTKVEVTEKLATMADAKLAIADMPAADVAPVVRCKGCKWFADNNGGEWYGCQMFRVVQTTPEDAPKPDDFCSYGEPKMQEVE